MKSTTSVRMKKKKRRLRNRETETPGSAKEAHTTRCFLNEEWHIVCWDRRRFSERGWSTVGEKSVHSNILLLIQRLSARCDSQPLLPGVPAQNEGHNPQESACTCSLATDWSPAHHIDPMPDDAHGFVLHSAPFVETNPADETETELVRCLTHCPHRLRYSAWCIGEYQ